MGASMGARVAVNVNPGWRQALWQTVEDSQSRRGRGMRQHNLVVTTHDSTTSLVLRVPCKQLLSASAAVSDD